MHKHGSQRVIAVDGGIFQWQRRGGISRIYSELLPLMAMKRPEWDFNIILRGKPKSAVLDGLNLWKRRILQFNEAGRFWRLRQQIIPTVNQAIEAAFWNSQSIDLYHPTFYTVPPVSIPSVCFVYDMIWEKFPDSLTGEYANAMRERKQACLENANIVLCISQSTMNDVTEILGIPRDKCRLCHLAGFIPPDLAADRSLKRGVCRPFLLFVGNHRIDYKNIPFLLNCLGDGKLDPWNELDMVIATPVAPRPEERERFVAAISPRRLHFVVDCDDAVLIDLYKSCAAFVFPSIYEGFGIPILEALACGAPVACSNTSSMPEVGGSVVNYFDPRSIDDCRQAIGCALSEGRTPEVVKRRQQHARSFAWSRSVATFVQAIEDALA